MKSPLSWLGRIWRNLILLETDGGKILLFQWGVEKVKSGEFAGSWMTVAVSMPRLAGQGS